MSTRYEEAVFTRGWSKHTGDSLEEIKCSIVQYLEKLKCS
jgi:hypothetical protein